MCWGQFQPCRRWRARISIYMDCAWVNKSGAARSDVLSIPSGASWNCLGFHSLKTDLKSTIKTSSTISIWQKRSSSILYTICKINQWFLSKFIFLAYKLWLQVRLAYKLRLNKTLRREFTSSGWTASKLEKIRSKLSNSHLMIIYRLFEVPRGNSCDFSSTLIEFDFWR